MKPVDQTSFGYPHGNCYAACIASLLEIPIEECPVVSCDDDWQEIWELWLRNRGLARIVIKAAKDQIHAGWQILAGLNGTGLTREGGESIWHACVGRDGVIVHDPNPKRQGLLNGEVLEVELLYLLDPSAMGPSF